MTHVCYGNLFMVIMTMVTVAMIFNILVLHILVLSRTICNCIGQKEKLVGNMHVPKALQITLQMTGHCFLLPNALPMQ